MGRPGDKPDTSANLPSEELEADDDGIDALEVEEEASDDTEGHDWSGVAPPDRKLIAHPVDLAVSDLVAQISSDDLHLNPVYQRRYVWDDRKASKLIESLLINVPIPVCYLAEESDGTRSTIDGQQRLRSLHRYISNEFSLRGLDVLSELNGSRFHQLSDRQQRLIRTRTIRCIVITAESHPDIRFDVFERLNTGSVALKAQELRNSMYRGSFNDLLHELANDPCFRSCLGNRPDKRMNFEELALRFFALNDGLLGYAPSFKAFLNRFMRAKSNAAADEIDGMRQLFVKTAARVHAVYGDNSFRRAYRNQRGGVERAPAVNSALYDAIMLNFAPLPHPPGELATRAADIQAMTTELMLDDLQFVDAISLATGDRTRLRRRVRLFSARLSHLGIDSGWHGQIAAAMEEESQSQSTVE